MKSMNDYTVRDIIMDRTIEVELHCADTDWPSMFVTAKVDTGADKCSMDASLISLLGWERVGTKTVKSSLGRAKRDVYRGKVTMRGTTFHLEVNESDRTELSHAILVGHNVIADLIILEEE